MGVVGHGVDLVEVERVRRLVSRHGEHALQRIFTDGERAYSLGTRRASEHLAARFAAKEAVFKALGTGWRRGIAWVDAEVVTEASGRPRVALHGTAAGVARSLGIVDWQLSLSHTSTHAIASAIALGPGGG